MKNFIFHKVYQFALTMLGVALLIFFMLRVIPGDIVEVKLLADGGSVTQEMVQAEKERLGLNKPMHEQLYDWVIGVATLDFGVSMWTGRPVVTEISERIGVSLEVAIYSVLLGTLIAIPLGIISSVNAGGRIDHSIRIFTVLGISLPAFWVGLLIQTLLLLNFGWLPPLESVKFMDDPIGHLGQILFPSAIVGWRMSAMVARMLRSSMLEAMHEDYVRTAKSKGLSKNRVIFKHVLTNALIPTITIIGMEFAFLLGGLVVTEQVFNLNGVGRLLVQSVNQSDYTLTQGLVMMFAFFFVVINICVDILYAFIDPRVQSRK